MRPGHVLRLSPPSVSMLAVVELLMVLLILAALNVLALQAGTAAVARARFSEALVLGAAERLNVVERLAHSGDPLHSPRGVGGPLGSQRNASDLLGRMPMSGAASPETGSKARPAPTSPRTIGGDASTVEAREADQGSSRYVRSIRADGAAIVVHGRLGDDPTLAFNFALIPVVQEGRVPQVVVWQCDRLAMPSGWTGPTVALDKPPPEAWLPSLCRRGGGML